MRPLTPEALALGVATLLAACLGLLSPAIVRRLPMPADEPDARPYSEALTPRFRLAVGLSGLAALMIGIGLNPPHLWPAWAALGTGGVLLSVIDAYTGFLPLLLTRYTFGLAVVGVLQGAWWSGSPGLVLVATLAGAGAYALFWLMWRLGGGLGFGDVRLAGIIGLVTGASSGVLAAWSLVIGGLVGVGWGFAVRHRRGRDGPFPYGPALVSGAFIALVLWRLTAPAQ